MAVAVLDLLSGDERLADDRAFDEVRVAKVEARVEDRDAYAAAAAAGVHPADGLDAPRRLRLVERRGGSDRRLGQARAADEAVGEVKDRVAVPAQILRREPRREPARALPDLDGADHPLRLDRHDRRAAVAGNRRLPERVRRGVDHRDAELLEDDRALRGVDVA
ncbi:MAG: hypothetical protein ABR521_02025 [Gaiellaceae bacterium]